MKLVDLIKDNVEFVRYQSGELWYRCANHDFEFPVPVSDTGEGVFLPEDKGVFFTRWIRPQLAIIEQGRAETC